MRNEIQRIQFGLKKFCNDGIGVTVIAKWVELSETTDIDPVTDDPLGGTGTQKTFTFKSLVHYINPTKNGYRMFNELTIGDAIIDIPGDVIDFFGKNRLSFEFAGEEWVQKEVSDKLKQSWSILFGDIKLAQSIVVTRKA